MGKYPAWGRVTKTKGQGLPATAEDRLGAIKADKERYPRWTLAMMEALPALEAQGRKWFQLYDKIADEKTLAAAWERIDKRMAGDARKRGAGPDGVTVEMFAAVSGVELGKLCKELKEDRYKPSPVRRHYIPKPGSGKMRPLGLPTIRDKVVQEATRGIIEPIWEARFLNASHGFRPGRSADSACREMEGHLSNAKVWVVDADIKGCFDNIPHETIIDLIAKRISDGKVIRLIRSMLEAGVMEEMRVRRTDTGTPQGGIISPLLCNIVLHELDAAMQRAGIACVRYADDFVLLCNEREGAEAALETAKAALAAMGLEISREKTRIVHLDEGFDFLGWHYQGKQRWPRASSVKNLKAKIKAKTRRNRPGGIEAIAEELEPLLRGWFNYFRNGNSLNIFAMIDGWLRRRLRSILKKRRKSHSGISSLLDNIRWPIKFFQDKGLFSFIQHLDVFRKMGLSTLPVGR